MMLWAQTGFLIRNGFQKERRSCSKEQFKRQQVSSGKRNEAVMRRSDSLIVPFENVNST